MIDPIWENKYTKGFEQRYPWDSVVSFVYRYAPKNKERKDIQILEVGFGSGSNLWFAAKEGFSVQGIEASETAVFQAESRFQNEGLLADLRRGDFVSLPFESNSADLVIDRAGLTHVGKSEHKKALKEILRVLKPGGFFHYNTYADSHSSSRSGVLNHEGVRHNITEGSLTGVGQVFFPSRADIEAFFTVGWKLHQIQRREWTDMLNATGNIHAEWLIVAEKIL